jgi:hypothetical protein
MLALFLLQDAVDEEHQDRSADRDGHAAEIKAADVGDAKKT